MIRQAANDSRPSQRDVCLANVRHYPAPDGDERLNASAVAVEFGINYFTLMARQRTGWRSLKGGRLSAQREQYLKSDGSHGWEDTFLRSEVAAAMKPELANGGKLLPTSTADYVETDANGEMWRTEEGIRKRHDVGASSRWFRHWKNRRSNVRTGEKALRCRTVPNTFSSHSRPEFDLFNESDVVAILRGGETKTPWAFGPAAQRSGLRKGLKRAARDWLDSLLADGPKTAAQVRRSKRQAGISVALFKYARAALNVTIPYGDVHARPRQRWYCLPDQRPPVTPVLSPEHRAVLTLLRGLGPQSTTQLSRALHAPRGAVKQRLAKLKRQGHVAGAWEFRTPGAGYSYLWWVPDRPPAFRPKPVAPLQAKALAVLRGHDSMALSEVTRALNGQGHRCTTGGACELLRRMISAGLVTKDGHRYAAVASAPGQPVATNGAPAPASGQAPMAKAGLGRPPLPSEQEDRALVADWKRAHAAGVEKKDFARGAGITLKNLNRTLNRVRMSESRQTAHTN